MVERILHHIKEILEDSAALLGSLRLWTDGTLTTRDRLDRLSVRGGWSPGVHIRLTKVPNVRLEEQYADQTLGTRSLDVRNIQSSCAQIRQNIRRAP